MAGSITPESADAAAADALMYGGAEHSNVITGVAGTDSSPVRLPEDQFHHICSFLDVSEVLRVASTCSHLNAWCR
jgi:hypothetical protein